MLLSQFLFVYNNLLIQQQSLIPLGVYENLVIMEEK